MSIELTLIPDGAVRTYALNDSLATAHVDIDGLFPKFPALESTFAIFWIDQLPAPRIVGFSTEGSNLLAVISLPTAPQGWGSEEYYAAIMDRCFKERDSILQFLRKSLSFEGINGRCVRSFILCNLVRQLQLDSVPVWKDRPRTRDDRCGDILIGGHGSERYEPNRKIDVVFGASSSACLVIDLGEWRWN
ncbi:hypothetical protein ACIGCH_16900 [Pseudomonas helleri]|uniref:Uncharacterized protein n=1 Tax=Pseudomonas helleri TaxID=1608996 RepID=A0A6A7YVD8_9PSED|nr:hypothetical protein [Pseudomonas helleri]MQT79507.1 hypothetical protein [Pseudomonas helleri]MQU28521.1 hypothetical protein [Pseudomonas helleri]